MYGAPLAAYSAGQPMFASFYHPQAAMFQPYATAAFPKYGMEEVAFFETLPFADAGLAVLGDLVEPKDALPPMVDLMDFTWLYGRQPLAESPAAAVPDLSALSPSEASPTPLNSSPEASSDSPSEEASGASSPMCDGSATRKQRKRKLASDLSPEELAKTREINRLAAQRHRFLAKKKQSEQQERYDAMGQRNDKLRQEIQQITTELNTLKRLVVSMYGRHGARHTALVSHMALPPMTLMRTHMA
jgi:hypothetical protein